MREIGIHDGFIAVDGFTGFQHHTLDIPSIKQDIFDRCIQSQVDAMLAAHLGHGFRYFTQAALGMINPVGMFHEGKDGKGTRTIPGGHAEVFGLKSEGKFEQLFLEVAPQDIHDRTSQRKMRQGFDQVRGEIPGQ